METTSRRKIAYIGSALKDLNKTPKDVKEFFEFAILLAAQGEKHIKAKPLKGFGSSSVLEVVEDHKSGTYRAVYTTTFKNVLYVLHVFQKKSKQGKETPKHDIDLVKQRLKRAKMDYEENFN